MEKITNDSTDIHDIENMPSIEALDVINIDSQTLQPLGDPSDIELLGDTITMTDDQVSPLSNKTDTRDLSPTFVPTSQTESQLNNESPIMKVANQISNESSGIHVAVSQIDSSATTNKSVLVSQLQSSAHQPMIIQSNNSVIDAMISSELDQQTVDMITESSISSASVIQQSPSPTSSEQLHNQTQLSIIQCVSAPTQELQPTIQQQTTTPPTSIHSVTPPIIQPSTPVLIIECTACHLPIKERYLLKAMDSYWHEDCLKCSCCDCRLGEVGSSLYAKANLLLCKRDYLRLFGSSGTCTVCRKTIPAFEMVMKVKANVYHLECFACQQCRQRFCVGDKFYLCENRILCEYDFEEQNLITSIQRGYNALSHMRRQAETLSDISSGYGSPSPGTM